MPLSSRFEPHWSVFDPHLFNLFKNTIIRASAPPPYGLMFVMPYHKVSGITLHIFQDGGQLQ